MTQIDNKNSSRDPLTSFLVKFFELELAGGILLLSATTIALLMKNSFLARAYHEFLSFSFSLNLWSLTLSTTVAAVVNDGLMTLFFLLIGLEIKRELVQGELSKRSQVLLPAIAAVGGMILPALIYVLFNVQDATALRGWAIPTATDIAFSLTVLSLLGKRISLSLKVFLTALAIFDDLGAILIIALFYHSSFSLVGLLGVFLIAILLFVLNRIGIKRSEVYLLCGFFLWAAMFKSGIHSTLAGVLLAFFIPLQKTHNDAESTLEKIEVALHPWVAFLIVPLFAFCNAGLDLTGISFAKLFDSVSLGIILGLFLGKQIGVFCCSWLLIKFRFAELPKNTTWAQLYGVSVLTGIGFTMSLFIGSLALDSNIYGESLKLGVIAGSFVSALFGYAVLSRSKIVKTVNDLGK